MSEIRLDNYILDTTIDEIIEDLQYTLRNGKLSTYKRTSSGIRIPCPHHSNGQERHESCYINDDGVFHCFTCGCSGNIVSFVSECLDVGKDTSKKWLLSRYKTTYLENINDFGDFDISKDTKTDYLDESILDTMQTYHPYMSKRKLSQKVCEAFKLRYDPKSECIVFPVWDEYNKLYMLTRRSVKNKNFFIDSDKEKPIYLYNIIKNKNINEVTICESQINALYLWSLGIPAVALFGTGTKHQYDILNKSSIKHYYLAFDGDNAGRKGIDRFLKNIRKDVFIDIMVLPEGKDINDLSEEEINSLDIVDSNEWKGTYGTSS